MALTVWKENLKRQPGVQSVDLPREAEILCAREQGSQFCLWFRCDPAAPLESRTVALIETGTGAPGMTEGRYLGSLFLAGGERVFHAFERHQSRRGK